jgi:hypothetical protein
MRTFKNFYSSANIVSMTNQGEIDGAYMGDIINRDHLGDLCADDRIILKWHFPNTSELPLHRPDRLMSLLFCTTLIPTTSKSSDIYIYIYIYKVKLSL